MKSDVLVIGNGYDLAHGLKTKYSDFLDCIRQELDDEKVISAAKRDEFRRLIKSNGFIQFFLDYEGEVPGWIDCERLMKYVITQINLFIHHHEEYGIKTSIFIDRNIPKEQMYILDCFPIYSYMSGSANGDAYQFNKKYFSDKYGLNKSEILKLLKKHLDELICALQIYLQDYLTEERRKAIVGIAQISDINPSYVISFNYTDTYKIYGINSEDVFHVHGSLNANNMVMGFDDDNVTELDFVYFKKYFQRIQKLTGYMDEDKFWIREPGKSYERPIVHFYGHSMDKTDGDIIQKLISQASGFVIYTYNQEDYERKVINLIDILGKENATEMIQKSIIKFEECKDEAITL